MSKQKKVLARELIKNMEKYLLRKKIKDQKYRLIKSLLYFKSKKNTKSGAELETNLEKKYYTQKIRNKNPKYTIKKDYLREDGWMNASSLAEVSNIHEGAVSDKIKPLIKLGIVEKKRIKWRHYKNPNRIFGRWVYRLKHDLNTFGYLYCLLKSENEKIQAADFLKLVLDKTKTRAEKEKDFRGYKDHFEKGLENTDYFSIIPKKLKLEWTNETDGLINIDTAINKERLERNQRFIRKIKKGRRIDKN